MSYQLTVEPLGASLDIAEGQTVLDACLRAGIWLPHACGHGLCGSCKVQVTDGDFEHGEASPFALMDFERDERKCLACCATAESDLVIEADIEEDPDARLLPVRDFACSVERIETLTPTIIGVHLRVDGPAMEFQAGQYVNLHIPGFDRPRAFSLASSPADGRRLELNIRRVPDGAATTWLHERLQPGQALTVSGPLGRFFVRKSDPKPLIFLAGGSGLSSPRSMILDLLEQGDDRRISLVHGARNRAELYYFDELSELSQRHRNFFYFPALSDEAPADWKGFCGYVHEAAEALFERDFRGHKAYLCGPPPMIEACIRSLMQGRLFERDIYTERFLSAADAASMARSPLFRNI